MVEFDVEFDVLFVELLLLLLLLLLLQPLWVGSAVQLGVVVLDDVELEFV